MYSRRQQENGEHAALIRAPERSHEHKKAVADLKAFFQPVGLSAEQKLEVIRRYEACNPALMNGITGVGAAMLWLYQGESRRKNKGK